MDTSVKSYVYALTPREHVRLDEPVLKIGRTGRDPGRRLVEYPSDSRLFRIKYVADAVVVERRLIKEFTARFQKTSYGTEYFLGNIEEMLACFDMFSVMPEEYPSCGHCKASGIDNKNGAFFCCGWMHFTCIDRYEACGVCKMRFDKQEIHVFTFGVPWYRTSPHIWPVATPEDANILVLYLTPQNHCEGLRYAYQALMEDKWCYLWFNPLCDWSGVDLAHVEAVSRQVRCHGMLGALLFRPIIANRVPVDSINVASNQPRASFTLG